MLKLNSKTHGIIDYVVVIFLWLSPALFDLPVVTSVVTYVLGVVHLILTVTTEFEMGLIRRIPMKVHGLIELIVSFLLVPIAFLLNSVDGEQSKRFYLCFALVVFVTWMLTDYHSYEPADES
jgi:hypothetical protein